VAEEETAPPAEEFTPAPQAQPEAPIAEATLPEASVVEGEYSAEAAVPPKSSRSHQKMLMRFVFLLTGAEVGGTASHRQCPWRT
jgi:hypothetical protein